MAARAGGEGVESVSSGRSVIEVAHRDIKEGLVQDRATGCVVCRRWSR